jgi:nitroreductase
MHVLDAIRTRRTIYDFEPEPLPADTVARLLDSAIWAPNHRLTQPWRFTLIGPETKTALARALGDDRLSDEPEADPALRQTIREKAEQKILSRPTIVAVTCLRSEKPSRQTEDLAATAAAIQNIQLAAWADGIGVQWSTGRVNYLPNTPQSLGFDEATEQIVGLLFMGRPAKTPAPQKRRPVSEVLRTTP